MKRRVLLTLGVFCFLGSVALPVQASANEDATMVALQAAGEEAAGSDNTFSHIVELLPEDFRPAFSREVVIKLNTLVKRSYAVVSEYDQAKFRVVQEQCVNSFTDAIEDKCGHYSAKLKYLHNEALKALNQIRYEAHLLRNGKEYYNAAVLAGMLRFVEAVELELGEASQKLTLVMSDV